MIDLEELAEDYSQQRVVEKTFRPFDENTENPPGCHRWIDPLAKWCLEERVRGPVRKIIVLLNWTPQGGIDQVQGSVEQCVT
jgi:hypothetical protein